MGKAVAKCPPYRLIASVADGDEKEIEKMLQFYDAYLSKCCLRPLYDEYGNLYIAVFLSFSLTQSFLSLSILNVSYIFLYCKINFKN